MTISTMSMALNVGIGVTVWMSDLPLVAQIMLTAILIVKMVLFYFTAWMADDEKIRKAGSVAIIALNIGMILCSLIMKEYFVALTTVTTLVMFGVWSFAVVFDFDFKQRKKK